MGLFRRRVEPKPGNVAAVLLAGGRSERFGSPKGLAELDGRPMVQWVSQLAAAVAVETILVLEPDADEAEWRRAVGQPAAMVPGKRPTSLRVVKDPTPYAGPVAGVRASLEVIDTPFVLLLAVDMPLLRPDLLLGLMERLVGHDAVAYHLEGWWRPFPALWKRDALEMAVKRADHQGISSLHGLLDLVDARPLGPEFLTLFDADASTLKSLNTRADLEDAEARRSS